ncbi:MAG: DUF6703 family protein [Natronosporangium sp.]
MTTSNDDRPDWLARLTSLNPTVVLLGTLALFLGVLLLPDPVGAALVLAIAAGLGWLLTRTWPVLAPSARTMRLVVIGLLVGVAALKLLT